MSAHMDPKKPLGRSMIDIERRLDDDVDLHALARAFRRSRRSDPSIPTGTRT